MAAYRRVYDSRNLQADCQELGSAPEPYSEIEYGLPLPFTSVPANAGWPVYNGSKTVVAGFGVRNTKKTKF